MATTVTTRSTDPRITFRHSTPDVNPATSFSTNCSGVAPGSGIYPTYRHAPAHHNVFHGPAGVVLPGDDPLRIWARETPTVGNGRIQKGSTADTKNGTGGATADAGEGRMFGWFGESYHPLMYSTKQGIGNEPGMRGGSSSYYVAWPGCTDLYLVAPPNGTALLLRPQADQSRGDGLKWDEKPTGRFRCRWRGPRWLRQGHPLGVPLGSPGFEDWVHWGSDAPPEVEWYPIPEFQLVVKPVLPGLTDLDDIRFGGIGVPSHAEYTVAFSPMPPHPVTGEPQHDLMQQLVDAGVNWGHPKNVLPDSPAVLSRRKAEGINLRLSEGFTIPSEHPWQGAGVTPVSVDPLQVVLPSTPPDMGAPAPEPVDMVAIPSDMDVDLDPIRARLTAAFTALDEVVDLVTSIVAMLTAADHLVDDLDDIYGDGTLQ